ncbi:hypothetical protein ACFX13_020066 [Malus domestica]
MQERYPNAWRNLLFFDTKEAKRERGDSNFKYRVNCQCHRSYWNCKLSRKLVDYVHHVLCSNSRIRQAWGGHGNCERVSTFQLSPHEGLSRRTCGGHHWTRPPFMRALAAFLWYEFEV